jgi:hypothetical protein
MELIYVRFEDICMECNYEKATGSLFRLLNFLRIWTTDYWIDFTEKLKFSLLVLLLEMSRWKALKSISENIFYLVVDNAIIEPTDNYWWIHNLNTSTPNADLNLITKRGTLISLGSWINDYDCSTIAEQITILDWNTFSLITVNHFIIYSRVIYCNRFGRLEIRMHIPNSFGKV